MGDLRRTLIVWWDEFMGDLRRTLIVWWDEFMGDPRRTLVVWGTLCFQAGKSSVELAP